MKKKKLRKIVKLEIRKQLIEMELAKIKLQDTNTNLIKGLMLPPMNIDTLK